MTRIAIIGSGFGGLAAAIELKRHGHDDLVLFEKADRVGGVWRENTYPGAACDVPSPYYSFSYEPNPRWSRRYAPQPEILAYLDEVADKYDVRRHVRFGVEVSGARYDEATGRWALDTSDGTEEVDVLVPAVGQLSRPSMPEIPGRETFRGPQFHSAEWDHSVDLQGRRVAVIGTGASAIQFVPELQPVVDRLTVFQRTPPYIVPRMDTVFSETHHRIFERLPLTQLSERGAWFAGGELLAVAFLKSEPLHKVVESASRTHMKRQTKSVPGLFEKVWPSYPIGCKRILFSSNYLPALTQPNVDLVTEHIREIRPEGVVTADGALHEADVVVYGTGFKATEILAPLKITGEGGRSLDDEWREGARAYLGISVPYFPNLFLMYGPNTNLGTGSIVAMLEAQARYLRQAVDELRPGAPLVVSPTVATRFDRRTQARLAHGVWSMCSNWYRNAHGRIVTNWPGTVSEYLRATRTFRREEYHRVEVAG